MPSSGGLHAARIARHGHLAILAGVMTPVRSKQGRVVSPSSHPRVVAPAIAADCSLALQNDCSLNFTRSTILFSLTRAAGDARGGVSEAA